MSRHLRKSKDVSKKFLSTLMSLVLVLSFTPIVPLEAHAATGTFDIELTPQTSGMGAVNIDWSDYPGYEDMTFKVYGSPNGGTTYSSVDVDGDASYLDTDAHDTAAPDAPSADQVDKIINVTAKDNGSDYRYYVESYNDDDELVDTSDTADVTVKTEVSGYRYIFDDSSLTEVTATNGTYVEPEPPVEPEEGEEPTTPVDPYAVSIDVANGTLYFHVAAVDGAGNVSATTTKPVNYALTFNTNTSSGGSMSSIFLPEATINAGNDFIVDEPEEPIVGSNNTYRSGYKFTGWYDDANATVKHDFTLPLSAADATVYAGWEPVRGTIEIAKKSANSDWTDGSSTGYSLSGAVYEVTLVTPDPSLSPEDADKARANPIRSLLASSPNLIYSDELVTDYYGTITIPDLYMGTYSIKEVTPSLGYDKVDGAVLYSLLPENCDVTQIVESLEPPRSGQIKLTMSSSLPSKVAGNDYYSLAGAKFDIIRIEGGAEKVYATIETNELGYAETDPSVNPLPYGDYVIRQIEGSEGYLVSPTEYDAAVFDDAPVQTVVVTEDPMLGTLSITKKSADESVTDGNSTYHLENAIYAVKVMNGSGEYDDYDTITTDEQGYAEITEVPLGSYRIIETQASEGYDLDETPYDFDVTDETYDTELHAYSLEPPLSSSLSIEAFSTNPTWTDGNLFYDLDGATFEVRNVDTDVVADTIIIDEDGYGTSRVLPLGVYSVTQLTAGDGYIKSDTPLTYQITAANYQSVPVQRSGQVPMSASIDIVKRSAKPDQTNGNDIYSLANAVYDVYWTKGGAQQSDIVAYNLTTVQKTDENSIKYGYDELTNLPLGGYVVVESSPSNGFKLDTNRYSKYLNYQNCSETWHISSTEPVVSATAKVVLHSGGEWTKDSECYSLDGATFKLTGNGMEQIFEIVDNHDGTGSSASVELPVGTYSVVQESVSTGFVKDPTVYSLVISSNSDDTVFVDAVATPRVSANPFSIVRYDADGWNSTPKRSTAQGGGELEGAGYVVKYYDGYYSSIADAEASGSPTWATAPMIAMKDNGKVRVVPSEVSLVSNGKGTMGYPLGTYVIENSSASSFYYLDSNKKMFTVTADEGVSEASDGVEGALSQIVTGELESGSDTATGALITSDNPIVSASVLKRADIDIYKYAADYMISDDDPDTAPQEGVKFAIVNPSQDVYRVTDGTWVSAGDVIYTLTTKQDGHALTSEIEGVPSSVRNVLPLGTYVIEEDASTTPSGYVTAEPTTITLTQPEDATTVSIANKTGVPIKIVNKIKGTNTQIASPSVFGLVDAQGNRVSLNGITEFSTDSTGAIVIPTKVRPGTYKLIQVTPPFGYDASSVEVPFTVGVKDVKPFSEPFVVEFENESSLGMAIIENRVGETADEKLITSEASTIVVKAHTAITMPDGTPVYEAGDEINGSPFETANGVIQINGLYPGKYDVIQTKAPHGYILNEEIMSFDIVYSSDSPAIATVVVYNAQQRGVITVYATDAVYGDRVTLPGAEFELRADADILDDDGTVAIYENTLIETLISDNDGYATTTSPVLPGKYRFSLLTAPNGYLMNYYQKGYVEVTLDSETGLPNSPSAEMPLTLQTGRIAIEKQDALVPAKITGNHAKFDIVAAEDINGPAGNVYAEQGKVVSSVETGDDGTVMTDYLYVGKYLIRETQAPVGYLVSEDVPVEVKYAGQFAKHATNAENTPTIVRDERDLGLVTVSFRDTSSDKMIPVEGMQANIAAVEDIYAPDGVTKMYSAGDVVGNFVTGEDGVGTVDGLYPGRYTVSMTQAPSGYLLTSETHGVELKIDKSNANSMSASVRFDIAPAMAAITVKKVDSDSNTLIPVAGGKFQISAKTDIVTADGSTRATAGSIVDTVETNANGIAITKQLYPGSYYVTESQAPKGYALAETVMLGAVAYVNQNIGSSDYTIEFRDAPQLTKLIVKKVDAETNQPISIEGVPMRLVADEDIVGMDGEIRYAKGTILGTLTTDANGTCEITKALYEGKYSIMETQAPAGYQQSSPVSVEVAYDTTGAEVIERTVFAPSVSQRAKLTIDAKSSKDNSALEGAAFSVLANDTVFASNGSILYRKGDVIASDLKTNGSGSVTVDLPLGKFVISQISAPVGYNVAVPAEVELVSSGTSVAEVKANTTIKNAPITAKVTVVDSKGQAAKGFSMKLVSVEGGKIVAEWTSTVSPREFSAIAAGSYDVVCLKAPDGYDKPATQRIEVVQKADTQSFKVTAGGIGQLVPNGTYVISSAVNSSKSNVIDIAAGSEANKANAQIWVRNSTDAQVFTITYDSKTESYTITNVNSGKLLTLANATCVNGVNVIQQSKVSGDIQKWKITKNGSAYVIASAANPSFVLDLKAGSVKNGNNVQIWKSNGTNAQKWNLTSVTPLAITGKTIANGTYTLVSKISSNKVLDIAGASKNNRGNAQLWTSNGTNAQKFLVTYDGKGFYTLKNISSGKYLDTAAAGIANGTNVWQWTGNGTDAQKWRIIKNSDGSYTLQNKLSGKALDIAGGKSANGTNARLWTSNGTVAQKWAFKSV